MGLLMGLLMAMILLVHGDGASGPMSGTLNGDGGSVTDDGDNAPVGSVMVHGDVGSVTDGAW